MYEHLTSQGETILKCINTELAIVLGLFNDEIYNEDDYICQTGQLITLQGKIINDGILSPLDDDKIEYLTTKHN